MEVPPQDKDLLGRWKPEGSDTYARTFAGRVARLQALFAKVARGADRYDRLDEREIAADSVPWLMERAKLSREQAELTVSSLRRRAGDADSSQASATEPEARYVIVELPGAIFRLHKAGASGCWMGRKRAFRNSRGYTARPKAHDHTHVCKLCWPARAGNPSDDDPSEGSLANSGDELEEFNSPARASGLLLNAAAQWAELAVCRETWELKVDFPPLFFRFSRFPPTA